MIELTIWYILIAGTGALAAFVAARAWEYLPGRLFVLVCGSLLLVRLFADMRDLTSDPAQVVVPATLSLANIALLDLLLLMLFAALFVPGWYQGRRPIAWIAVPYALAALLIVADGLAGLGIIFAGVSSTPDGLRLQPARPGGIILLVAFVLSWVPHLAVLAVAFLRQPAARVSIGLLLVALVLGQLTGLLGLGGLLQSLPIVLALAYTVLTTRLLLPTRVGIDAAVQVMDDPVLVLDGRGGVAYANPAALVAGMSDGEMLAATLSAAEGDGRAVLRGRSFTLRHTTLDDRGGRPIGALLIGRDVTELERRERTIDEERDRLTEAVRRLAATQAERAELAEAMRQLALPVIPVLPGVLIMPLVGNFDGPRIDSFSQTLLQSAERERARLVLLDITGIPLLDTSGAAGLLNGVRAAALLGARCVLVGVRPEIAQTLVGLGVNLDEIATAATLQQAIQHELAR